MPFADMNKRTQGTMKILLVVNMVSSLPVFINAMLTSACNLVFAQRHVLNTFATCSISDSADKLVSDAACSFLSYAL